MVIFLISAASGGAAIIRGWCLFESQGLLEEIRHIHARTHKYMHALFIKISNFAECS